MLKILIQAALKSLLLFKAVDTLLQIKALCLFLRII